MSFKSHYMKFKFALQIEGCSSMSCGSVGRRESCCNKGRYSLWESEMDIPALKGNINDKKWTTLGL